MGDAPFFGCSAKRGYQNAKGTNHTPNILSFVQHLNLRNSTIPQVIARMWHNARPRKVGTLIWLTFNKGLPVGSKQWVSKLTAKVVTLASRNPPSTASWTVFLLNWLGRPSTASGKNGRCLTASPSLGPSSS